MEGNPRTRTHTNKLTVECPLCRDTVANDPYPRHTMILQDESDDDRNRRAEHRLCPSCWEALFSDLVQAANR